MGTKAQAVGRPQFRERSQATAAAPEKVSDSLTNEVRCGDAEGHYLTEAVKDAIWVLRAEGVSEAEIGRRLGLPKRTVSKYL
jgi:DNA-binding NarL/FixJ family response regulator